MEGAIPAFWRADPQLHSTSASLLPIPDTDSAWNVACSYEEEAVVELGGGSGEAQKGQSVFLGGQAYRDVKRFQKEK